MQGLHACAVQSLQSVAVGTVRKRQTVWYTQAPVFRELYSEKRVVAEERRARIDNAPMGRFQVCHLSAARI